MDPSVPNTTALAIKDGRIVWVESWDDFTSWIGSKTQTINLKGAYVYPGFIDTHMHVLHTGTAKSCLQLQACQNKAEILKSLQEHMERC